MRYLTAVIYTRILDVCIVLTHAILMLQFNKLILFNISIHMEYCMFYYYQKIVMILLRFILSMYHNINNYLNYFLLYLLY